MNHFEFHKIKEIYDLIEKNIEELNLVRNSIKRSINDLYNSEFSAKTKELESLLHDNDIKLMTLILLEEKVKGIIGLS